MPANSFPNLDAIEQEYGKRNFWSGPGSTIQCTADVRTWLPHIIQEFHIDTIFDAGCGDWQWMSQLYIERLVSSYVGGEVVMTLRNRLQNEHSVAAESGGLSVSFEHFDIITQIPPQVDLIICRDVLMHMKAAWIDQALTNFVDSGSRYLLATTFPWCERLRADESKDYQWHPINLAHFGFSHPLLMFRERHPRNRNRCMSLYDLWEHYDR